MTKMFKVSKESDLIFQRGLVEREISELMRSRKKKVNFNNIGNAESTNSMVTEDDIVVLEPGTVSRRPISEGDVCPICLDNIQDANSLSLTYCKFSCGNNVHFKCMNILIEHQSKSMGLETIKCPLCRNDFGKVDDLKKEFGGMKAKQTHSDLKEKHFGSTCNECGVNPIVGKMHRFVKSKTHFHSTN
jgi:E3 ubiquitin-protein ligase ZSWIM2